MAELEVWSWLAGIGSFGVSVASLVLAFYVAWPDLRARRRERRAAQLRATVREVVREELARQDQPARGPGEGYGAPPVPGGSAPAPIGALPPQGSSAPAAGERQPEHRVFSPAVVSLLALGAVSGTIGVVVVLL